MSFNLGEVAPLGVTVTDASGVVANAGSMTLTITLPDASTVAQAVSPSSTGVYGYDYPTTQAGRHGVRWVATGVNAGAWTDAFTVQPADDLDFISLAELKTHLKKTTTADDAELAEYISAACSKIVELIGPVSPTTVTDEVHVRPGCRAIVLERHPVIAVTSVEVAGSPATAVPEADPDAGTAGWVLDAGAGVLRHAGCWPSGTIRTLYRAGRIPVAGNVRLAGLELASHLWRSTKLNASGGRPGLSGIDEMVMAGSSYALPTRVRELLGLGKNPTADVMVG